MVDCRYTKAVDEIDISRESLSKVLSTLRNETGNPSDDHIIKPRIKRYKKVLLIAAAIIILLNIGMATASAIMGVNLYAEVYRFFDETINPKYVESYEDIESVSSGITVKVTDAVCDGYNVMLRLDISDPNLQQILSGDDFFAGTMGIGGADLYDEFGNHYEMSGGSGSGLGFDENQGTVLYFDGSPEFACEMHLFIKNINGVEGGWDMKFTVKPYLDAKEYTCDTVFEFENGTKIKIDTVEQYITCTLIKGTYLDASDPETGTVHDAVIFIGDERYGIHSISSAEYDLEIKLGAIEGELTESELKITLGDHSTERMKLNLIKE